ncbi:D-ribose pyranase [Thermoanaerobacteraceae bacterium SP2]|nr:D-ribose pyranase [Thermoanaerobacteraceae bacterium SP2]
MIKKGILHPQLKHVLTSIGHQDYLAMVDSGYCIPLGVERVDLAFLPNIPTMLQVLDGVLDELAVEKIILAEEIHEHAPEFLKEIKKRFPDNFPIEFVPHVELKEIIKQSKAVVRTGDFGTHYGNMVLVAGCVY